MLVDGLVVALADRTEEAIHDGNQDPSRWQQICLEVRRSLPPNHAIKVVRAACERNPDSPALKIAYAEACMRLGWIGQAEATLLPVLAERPRLKRALATHAKVAQRGDQAASALQRWQRFLACHPDDPTALRQLAECFADLGERERAIQVYEQILGLGADDPLDHYSLAELQANARGNWLTLEESASLVERFGDDPEVARRHVTRLRLAGNLHKAREVEASYEPSGAAHGKAQSSRFPAVRLLDARRYEDAAEAYVETFADHRNEMRHVARAAECLALADKHSSAMDLLDAVSNDEPHDLLLRAQATVYQMAGDDHAALKHQVRAVRLCSNLTNLSKLCSILLGSARIKAAGRVIDRIERDFGDSRLGWVELARLTFNAKDAESAVAWMQRALASIADFRRIIFSYADALWECGEIERAWFALVAHVTDRHDLLSTSKPVRLRAFKDLQEDLRETKRALDGSASNEELLGSVRSLKQTASAAYILKSNGYLDRRTDDFLRDLNARQAAGDLTAAAALMDEQIDAVLARTALPVRNGDLLYRAARLNEELGRTDLAFRYLERAAWMNKDDPLLVSSYRSMLRANARPLKVKTDPPIAVLVLTWKGNLPRARFLATQIAQRSGIEVIALRGDPDAQAPELLEEDFGHQLIVPCDDGYLALSRKLMLAYRYLYACTNLAGVFKIDDDAAIEDFDKFRNMCKFFYDSNADYMGNVTTYTNGTYHHGRDAGSNGNARVAEHSPIDYCMGGLGYYLSRLSLRTIFERGLTYFSSDNERKVYEDVFFGEILRSAGITPTHVTVAQEGGLYVEIFEPFMLLAPDILGDEEAR